MGRPYEHLPINFSSHVNVANVYTTSETFINCTIVRGRYSNNAVGQFANGSANSGLRGFEGAAQYVAHTMSRFSKVS